MPNRAFGLHCDDTLYTQLSNAYWHQMHCGCRGSVVLHARPVRTYMSTLIDVKAMVSSSVDSVYIGSSACKE